MTHCVLVGQKVERVNEYKYLGTVIDDKLNWNENSKVLYGKANQRLFFLRKLRKFNVDRNILTLFYRSVVQSILTFCIICNFGSLSQSNKGKFERIRKMAQRTIGVTLINV